MRALGVHEDVIVFVSRLWQTTATAVRSGDEAFLIDSPVLPDELDALPAVLEQAGFAVKGLLTTHADWDHVLGRYAFPEAPLGCGESTAERLRAEPGVAQRQLRDFDEKWYVERPGPLSLAALQALPVPGRCEIGERDIELHPTGGHTVDGTAFFAPWAGALVVGDHLSPVEIPWIQESGSREAYLETLERLRPLVERAETVIPGHGRPQSRDAARRLLDEDVAYLEALAEKGADAPLPPSRDSGAQRRIHAENVARLGG